MLPHFMSRSRAAAAVSVLALCAACAIGPKLFSDVDPGANFAAYRTYGFQPVLSTDESQYSTLLSEYLRTAVSRELEARGYTMSANPDLLVNFKVASKEKIQGSTGPAFGGYFGYRRGAYGAWAGYPGETRVTQYTEGTLNVDLVDAGRKQLVWQGTLIGIVREEERRNLQQTVTSAVNQIFSQYPYRAGSAERL